MAKGPQNWQKKQQKSGTLSKAASGGGAPARKQVLKQRITGKVIEWKGKFGWIQATQPVKHPDASKNSGRIFMSQNDVEQEISGVGAKVSFFVYSDGKGLGAQNVRPGGAAQPQQASQGKKQTASGAKGTQKTAQDSGARQRIPGQRLFGKVEAWKGTYGWIVPSTKVSHPEAAKKGGKIYVSQDDVEQELSGVGAQVSFFLYKDKTGLGAMHVRPGKAGQNQGNQAKQGKQGKQGKQQLVKNTKLKSKQEQKKEKQPIDKSKRKVVSIINSGTIIKAVRGNVAWIRPDGDIDHPKWKAQERKNLFLHNDDIEGGELPKRGSSVLFSLYEDDQGLGAQKIQVLEQGDGTLPEHLQAEIDEHKKARAAAGDKEQKGKQQGKKNVKMGAFAKKQANKQTGKKENGPSGPDLARTRVSDAPVVGEVVSMGKQFGWVKPSEPFKHKAADKHGGKIYLHKNDIASGAELTKGTTVTFHVYVDASGLGAEECS